MDLYRLPACGSANELAGAGVGLAWALGAAQRIGRPADAVAVGVVLLLPEVGGHKRPPCAPATTSPDLSCSVRG